MKQPSGIFHPGILQKLLLMHLLVFIVFAMTILAVFLSFRDIESFSRTIIDTDVKQVVTNAQLGRSLNGVFVDTDLLVSTFLNRGEGFTKEAARISSQVSALEDRHAPPQLREALKKYTSSQRLIFQQLATAHGYSRALDRLEQNLDAEISSLEGALSQKLITLAGEGRDASILEQLSIIIPGSD